MDINSGLYTSSQERRRFLAGSLTGGAAAFIVAHDTTAQEAAKPGLGWDYIIVGGGSAGCVLARRLSEDAAVRVLLIEAGPVVHDPQVSSPPAWPSLMGGRYDWSYHSTPQAGLDARVLPQPRGKGLGGSSLINALGFQRGPQSAYDCWADATDDARWSYACLLPYFRKLETASTGADEYRGGDGPLHVLALQGVPQRNPLAEASHAGATEIGFTPNPDWNGASAEGVIWAQYSQRGDRRDDVATAFLQPVLQRPNLGVMTGAQVLGLAFERGRCTGVKLAATGATLHIRARQETVLSAGAIDTPRLLLLSGVGPADTLKRLGIPPVADLTGVGQNLHDHPLAPGLLFKARRPIPPSIYNHCETMAVGRTSHSPGWADMQLMTLSVPFLSPTLGAPPPGCFSIVPALMYPRSRGALSLQDADPRTPAKIDPSYLTEPGDVDALAQGMEMGRALAASLQMREWNAEEMFPGRKIKSRSAMAGYLRQVASPFFHPVSTCAMGRAGDTGAVVDPECRVRGVEGLRIVDASIFPSIPQAMINAAVLAVAECSADLMRGLCHAKSLPEVVTR